MIGKRLIDVVTWNQVSIPAGASVGKVELTIGRVGSGRPKALIISGIHGDEAPWGAWAIRMFLENAQVGDLSGSLQLVPVANPLALDADARNAPLDELDLNRSFPGRIDGSHTERLAAALVEHALERVDVVVDLHGGGSWCLNSFAFSFPGGEELSKAFKTPFIAKGVERSNTITGYARGRGAVVVAVEMGGRSEEEELWAKRIADGLRRALGVVGVMKPTHDSPDVNSIMVGPSKVLRPTQGGILLPLIRTSGVGKIVSKGKILGQLLDPCTMKVIETFEAPFPKTAILLLRPTLAKIDGGAMTYVVAPVIESKMGKSDFI